ncbi:hypothetical protein BGZ60DRAFT_522284 [Tricladium varicosporioides]|nr:hypothetical protein BGZ60DRAFT_522284 [Hymenoscyphus varicosporioides]
MSEVTELIRSNIGTAHSLMSVSTDSSCCGSSKPALLRNLEPSPAPSPSSPRSCLKRKRAASLNLGIVNDLRIGDSALNSGNTSIPSATESAREQVCLCQPDPKIPRPRNAFILYRQHYQAQVAQQNPGLANPEISKIIGEQWREQAPEVKSEWKRLAEEEKQRHQRQYPGYRYQPRRSGKGSAGIRPISSYSREDSIRCPKCNGRYLLTPSTPLTPLIPTLGSNAGHRNNHLLPPFMPARVEEGDVLQYPSRMLYTGMDMPRIAPPYQQQVPQRRPYPHPQKLQIHRKMDEEVNASSPLDSKRRRMNSDAYRYNEHGCPAPSPMSYSAPHRPFSRSGPLPMSAGPHRQHLPDAVMIGRPGSMAPPPSHSPINPQQRCYQYPRRPSGLDESLRLPPLQTQQLPSGHAVLSAPSDRHSESGEAQAKSVEAMIMTIPYINKIKVLTKISPPLALPGPTSPGQEIRGVVIVIEAVEQALRDEIGMFITDHLVKDPSCAVKIWGSSPSASKGTESSKTEAYTRDEAVSPRSNPWPAPSQFTIEDQDPFVDYFKTICEWHKTSQEIIEHITTDPTLPPPATSHHITRSLADPSLKFKTTPIALIPNGFSITTSDIFARRIPINDAYSPVDHWQWMATLWRGIVGPDLTIYVKRVGKEEMGKFGGVEVKKDCSAIVVRVVENMGEKTTRRLGFEVLEYIRGMDVGFERA